MVQSGPRGGEKGSVATASCITKILSFNLPMATVYICIWVDIGQGVICSEVTMYIIVKRLSECSKKIFRIKKGNLIIK